jgi:hypothetical protein
MNMRAAIQWLFAFTQPAGQLPRVTTPRRRDAVVPFASADASVVLRVDLLPRNDRHTYDLIGAPEQNLFCLTPRYTMRAAIQECPPTTPRIHVWDPGARVLEWQRVPPDQAATE